MWLCSQGPIRLSRSGWRRWFGRAWTAVRGPWIPRRAFRASQPAQRPEAAIFHKFQNLRRSKLAVIGSQMLPVGKSHTELARFHPAPARIDTVAEDPRSHEAAQHSFVISLPTWHPASPPIYSPREPACPLQITRPRPNNNKHGRFHHRRRLAYHRGRY